MRLAAPGFEAVGGAFFGDRFAFPIVKLPRNGAAFGPSGAFGPGEEDFAAPVADDDRMLGLGAVAGMGRRRAGNASGEEQHEGEAHN